MKKLSISIFAVLVIAGLGWFVFLKQGLISEETAPEGESAGQKMVDEREEKESVKTAGAPNFELRDYDGRIVRLSDFAGKPVVINSWAAWCPFCGRELPDFAAVQKEFSGQVTVIAIDRAEPFETAKKYTDDLGVTDDLLFLLDPEDDFYEAIGGFAMPETIFVDKNGIIVFHKRGPMDAEEFRIRVKELIGI